MQFLGESLIKRAWLLRPKNNSKACKYDNRFHVYMASNFHKVLRVSAEGTVAWYVTKHFVPAPLIFEKLFIILFTWS